MDSPPPESKLRSRASCRRRRDSPRNHQSQTTKLDIAICKIKLPRMRATLTLKMNTRALVPTILLAACGTFSIAQQVAQPGTKWTEDQLRRAVAPSRAGKRLTPKAWPNNSKVAVCLSFDVDNESYLLARGETSPTTLSAADFGAQTGLPRILELLDRYQIPASFFIPAVSAIIHPEMIPAILKRGRHEIGVHGWIHESLAPLGEAEEERLLNQAIEYLTKAGGKRPVGYRAPSWAF